MQNNQYDDEVFFEKYSGMTRSVMGLKGAGEWHELEKMLPDFQGRRVLDLGCGFGWHCAYAVEHGAASVLGLDSSEKMLNEAMRRNASPKIRYENCSIEEYSYPEEAFDIVLSSLAFHYLKSFSEVCRNVRRTLTDGGAFVFSVEHPVFTAYGTQDWIYECDGAIRHWPVDRYFEEGERRARFLGEDVKKYHRTLTTYLNGLLDEHFRITGVVEPRPAPELLDTVPGMRDELRRPMMLLIAAVKQKRN